MGAQHVALKSVVDAGAGAGTRSCRRCSTATHGGAQWTIPRGWSCTRTTRPTLPLPRRSAREPYVFGKHQCANSHCSGFFCVCVCIGMHDCSMSSY